MKMRVSAFLCAAFLFAAASQPNPQTRPTGSVSGKVNWMDNPASVLTLADDTGELGGTLVLNLIKKENGQARIVAVEPHVLLNPRREGDRLAFQCRKLNGGVLDFSVKFVAADKATIHCLNCGPDAPTVEMVRAK